MTHPSSLNPGSLISWLLIELQRLREHQQELNQFRLNKENEVNKEREEFESFKRELQAQLRYVNYRVIFQFSCGRHCWLTFLMLDSGFRGLHSRLDLAFVFTLTFPFSTQEYKFLSPSSQGNQMKFFG